MMSSTIDNSLATSPPEGLENLEELDRLAYYLKVISDENRIRILYLLAQEEELCVCKVMDQLGLEQSLISHHLAVLREAGLVRDRREGRWIHYSLNRDLLARLGFQYLDIFGSLSTPAGKRSASSGC